MIWHTPKGRVNRTYKDLLENQPHLLIAGATGSGKSVVINGLIATALYNAPCQKAFILVDPKRVELVKYKHLPHTKRYASEPDDIYDALCEAMDICEQRYKKMQRRGEVKYSGGDLYVIIDEFADLMTTQAGRTKPLIQRLAQIGRAARVHIILATQTPIAKVLPTEIKCNFDARIALRTRSAQDSRNITGWKGCEDLPRYGQGYIITPSETNLYNIPMTPDDEIDSLIEWWLSQATPLRRMIRALTR